MSASTSVPWKHFLPPYECNGSEFAAVAAGKTVLVTGAGGFIGSALVKAMARAECDRIVLLDSSANALFEVQQSLSSCPARLEIVVGSVCDSVLLENMFRRFRPEQVYHTAALKHVPMAEFNPVAAVRDNALGTWLLAQTAARFSTSRFTAVSTDKAVNPRSIMGASKRIAELAVVTSGSADCLMNCVRLGNIIGSTGSVVPHFLRRIESGETIVVTHAEATRYFMPLSQAVDAILFCSTADINRKLLVPGMGDPVAILELANFLSRHAGRTDIPIEFVGLRPGEKLHEQLLLAEEVIEDTLLEHFRVVSTPVPAPDILESAMDRLADATAIYDVAEVIEAVCALVPEYVPGDQLLSATQCEAGLR